MKKTRTDIMGMPITIEIVGDSSREQRAIEFAYAYFECVDARFSTYKSDSEITHFNQGLVSDSELSTEMKEVLRLADETRLVTHGYFDMRSSNGLLDPSGIVKGWAIHNVADLLINQGVKNFFVEAGGDIETMGTNEHGQVWNIGIRSPFNTDEIVKRIQLTHAGIATSGEYIRGAHIYNPHAYRTPIEGIVSLSVIGKNAYEADRFATAAFAMGEEGIHFIESLEGFEGYAIWRDGTATYTTNFNQYVL